MTLPRQSLGWGHMGMEKSELHGLLWESESRVPKSFPPVLQGTWLAPSFLRDGWAAAQGPLLPFHQEVWGSWDGWEVPPQSPANCPHHDHAFPSREGGEPGPREALEKANSSRSSCLDGALEAWVGRRGSCLGCGAGGAQVLLRSSCLLLLWHLSPSSPA